MPRISPLPLALTALFTTAVTLYVLSSPPSPLSANVRGKFSGNRGRMAVPRGLRVGAGKIGVYGMGTMGQNLALNIADKGFDVSVSNRSPGREVPGRVFGVLISRGCKVSSGYMGERRDA
eukprot:1062514-Amorphochlora_amoeboformis.AAC.2